MGNAIGPSGIPNPSSPLVQASTFIFSRNPGRTLAGYQAMNDEQEQRKALPGMVSSMFPVPGDEQNVWSSAQQKAVDTNSPIPDFAKTPWSSEQQGAIDKERQALQYTKAFPEQAAAAVGASIFPRAQEPYTLGEGDTRFGGSGQVIARGAAKPQSQTIGTLVSPDGKSRRSMNIASPKAQELMDGGWVKSDDLQKVEATPETFRPATPDELKANGLPEGTAAQINLKTKKMDVISRPPAKTQIMYSDDGTAMGVFDPSEPDIAQKMQSGQLYLKPPRVLTEPNAKDLEAIANRRNETGNLLGQFKPEYGGNYILGGTENTARRLGGDDTGQAQWWQSLDALDAGVRNELYGASLTDSEKAAWEATTVTPRMNSGEITKRLGKRKELLDGVAKRRREFFKGGGYNMGQVNAFFPDETQGQGGTQVDYVNKYGLSPRK